MKKQMHIAIAKGNGEISGVASSAGLFCTFVIVALLLIIGGAQSYRAVAGRMDENYSCRTALSYVANKLRQSDAAGMVSVGERSGTPVLALREEINGNAYETLIYYQDGAIRELFTAAGEESLIGGEEIVPAAGLSFSKEKNQIRILLTDTGGRESELLLSLRSDSETAASNRS